MVTLNTTCHAFQRKESQGESFRRKIWWPGPRCCACAANEIFGIPTSDAMIACRTHLQDCVARWNAERRRERQERKNARIIHRAIGSERVCCYGFGWLSLIAVFILLRYHRYCLSIFVFHLTHSTTLRVLKVLCTITIIESNVEKDSGMPLETHRELGNVTATTPFKKKGLQNILSPEDKLKFVRRQNNVNSCQAST